MAAAVAVYEALFVERRLAAGEVPYVAVLAMSVAQANVVFAYCLGLLEASPVLKQEVASVVDSHNGQQEIRLRNGTVIAVMCSNFRRIRGRTLLACVLDEAAFSPDDETGCQSRSRNLRRALAELGHHRRLIDRHQHALSKDRSAAFQAPRLLRRG